ncbi:MAG: hypothetical protein IPP77_05055 [Bacteroidetes bacterium]|nr:hypothetical protein [Bacteroidota bacterium]
MKKSFPLLLLLAFSLQVLAQKKMNLPNPVVLERPSLAKKDLEKIKLMEDTLYQLSNRFVYDTSLSHRREACYSFIPKLVKALKFDNSFTYPFDSLITVSKIYPPDSSFRIFTWQLALPKGTFRYFGMIQMKSEKLKLFPLYDMSDTMSYMSQQVTTNENWYGCLYYNIIQKQANKKTIYTLFGFEAADILTRRKVVDILSFDEDGKPKFGAPLFYFKYEDTTKLKHTDTLTRFFLEYKYSASTVLNYDKALEMIVFDHVAPPTEKAKGATFTYVPDGTYEGFVWKNNRWNWVEKVFTFAINEDDNPPIPAPLFGTPKKQPELPGDEMKRPK